MSTSTLSPRRAALALALAVTATAPAAAHAAGSFTIRTKDDRVSRIGDFRTSGGRDAGLMRAAVREFGQPAVRRVKYGGNGCSVRWPKLRLRAEFVNYGGGGTACENDFGRMQTAVIRGRRFKTRRGVRVGTRSSRIPDLHPSAEFRRGAWWINTVYLPFGDGFDQATVKAIVRGGRVRALSLWIGAGGE